MPDVNGGGSQCPLNGGDFNRGAATLSSGIQTSVMINVSSDQ